jgi:hypothetical protein
MFSYYDYKLDKAYGAVEEFGIVVDFARFGEVSEIVFVSLLLLSFVISILSIIKDKEKLGFVGLIIFLINAYLFFC